MGLLDVIGPVMIGPSSSHTAGACRLALLARRMLVQPPVSARLVLHGSFAKTARGHGTDKALIAGLLGMFPDDARIPQAPELAKAGGLEVEFDTADLGDVHPNTVRIDLQAPEEAVSMMGSSLGGGLVRVFQVNGFEIDFSGSCYALLIEHADRPGVIARVARVIADDDGNIGRLHSARRKRGGRAMMSLEIDKHLSQYVLDYLTNLSYISWVRMLPEVMSGEAVADTEVAGSPDTSFDSQAPSGETGAPGSNGTEPGGSSR